MMLDVTKIVLTDAEIELLEQAITPKTIPDEQWDDYHPLSIDNLVYLEERDDVFHVVISPYGRRFLKYHKASLRNSRWILIRDIIALVISVVALALSIYSIIIQTPQSVIAPVPQRQVSPATTPVGLLPASVETPSDSPGT